MPYLGIFGLEFEKNCCHIWNQHPQKLSNCKFREKTKMSKLGTKNVWFGYFWAGIWKKYCHICNQHPQICLIAKYHEIMKMPKFGAKKPLFGYFGARISRNYCHIWNQHLRISVIAKFREETKMPKFGTKNALLGYFWPKMLYLGNFDQKYLIWVFLGENFKKTIAIFEISTLKFVYLQNFTKKQKCLNLGPKMLYLGIFGLEFKKNYCHIWNQDPWICLIAKYCEIMKMPKFGSKSALFGYFWARILKDYCHIWNQHLRISIIAKFCEETKMRKFGAKNALYWYFWPKMPFLGIFRQEFLKKLLSYLKSAPSNLSDCKIWQKNKNA